MFFEGLTMPAAGYRACVIANCVFPEEVFNNAPSNCAERETPPWGVADPVRRISGFVTSDVR
jgi:hypothetical protein